MRILFLTPYPKDTAGSQRFRFEQYYSLLEEKSIQVDVQSFISESTWRILYEKGYKISKAIGVFSGFLRRIACLTRLKKYDYVFIHREASPIGPPIFEWLISKVYRKKIIYDFDDAIWMSNTSNENRLVSLMKWQSKVNKLISWSHKVSCGNEFLADYARQFNDKVVVNPTTLDTATRHLPSQSINKKISIGWTGTHSTLKYLELIREPLKVMAKKYDFRVVVIADIQPEIELPNAFFYEWNKDTEIEDLNRIDIGLMPLADDEWAKGKCGFKALQFMALEKPVLVTPVGVNEEIVEDGVNGFHCQTAQDWEKRLEELLTNETLRKSMGALGRKKVMDKFSVVSNQDNFLGLFE